METNYSSGRSNSIAVLQNVGRAILAAAAFQAACRSTVDIPRNRANFSKTAQEAG
jgi:hypothetical protein